MTYAVTPVRTVGRELSTAAATALHIQGSSLSDGPLGRVGLELEAHCIDLVRPQCRPDWDRIQAVLAELPPLPGRSSVTVEPGGAIELSGPPLDGPAAAVAALAADRAVVCDAFRRAGMGLLLLGADPLRPAGRVHPGARYQAMEEFFGHSGTAMAGAAMMTSTAAIQVNVDAGPRDGWTERVRLAHALGPTMIALAANSPLLAGEFTGWLSSRQQVWGALDDARCGPILTASGDDPGTDWARYALKAPVMLVHDPEPVAMSDWVPLIDWVEGRASVAGRRPTTADVDYHLTTLFPPVRPRRWLEIRYLDAVPDALWPALVFALVTLLDEVPGPAAETVESVATAWDTAARVGLGDRRLFDAANGCLDLVAPFVPRELAPSLALLTDAVRRGRCPADDFAELVVDVGVEGAVLGSVGHP